MSETVLRKKASQFAKFILTHHSHRESKPRRPQTARVSGEAMPVLELQHLWFELARTAYGASVAFVSTVDGFSSLSIVHDLAHVASLNTDHHVLVVNASGIATAKRRATSSSEDSSDTTKRSYEFVDYAKRKLDESQVALVEFPRLQAETRMGVHPSTIILAAVDSPAQRAVMVPMLRAMDRIVLCTVLGKTAFTDVRRIVSLVGEDRILGSINIWPRDAE